MRALTIGLGLVANKLLPIYLDIQSSQQPSPMQALYDGCRRCGVEQQANQPHVACAVQLARAKGLFPFFFIDEVDWAYPHLPDVWKEVYDLSKIGGCVSMVAAGNGAMLRVKAFGDNAMLQIHELPPRNVNLVQWNDTKYKPRSLPQLTSQDLSKYLEFKGRPMTEGELSQLSEETQGNFRMIEEILFQGKELGGNRPFGLDDVVQPSFAPRAALLAVLQKLRSRSGPVCQDALLDASESRVPGVGLRLLVFMEDQGLIQRALHPFLCTPGPIMCVGPTAKKRCASLP